MWLEKVKRILPNGGLKMIYHGTIRKKLTNKNKSTFINNLDHEPKIMIHEKNGETSPKHPSI